MNSDIYDMFMNCGRCCERKSAGGRGNKKKVRGGEFRFRVEGGPF